MICRMRNTGDLSEVPGPANQASKRGTWNAVCLRDSPHAHSSEHGSHSRKITMETSLFFGRRKLGGIKSWTRKTNGRIQRKVSFVGLERVNEIKSGLFERRGQRFWENGTTASGEQGQRGFACKLNICQ